MKSALLLGNGKSRVGLPLEKYRGKAIIAGCNLLYRDFVPDYLLAVDQAMIQTIEADRPETMFICHDWQKNTDTDGERMFYLNLGGGLRRAMQSVPAGMKSGPSLGLLLPLFEPQLEQVLMVGMDMGSNDPKQLNNVYTGQPGYRRAGMEEVPYDRDISDWAMVFWRYYKIRWLWFRPQSAIPTPHLWSCINNFSVVEGWDTVEPMVDYILS